ncbi:amidohydrolase family protein [Dactylosporangium sp. NBC_01737]|uniref:amidohydrolase family protein n=1 Tax=Dactylosporangium sp. NBC_01737 TaxID=2975959 RepID=UPI002E0F7904|nr:amidohydrolase family protein [Dactylosporangium sp. NBC_01737]
MTVVVDAHHHLWDVEGGYSWLDDPALTPIRRTFSPADLRAELAGAGVSHTVLVEGGRCDEGEAAVLLQYAAETPQIAGVVAWADPADLPLERYRRLPGASRLVGLRAQVQAEPAGYLDRPVVREGLLAIGAAGLAFDLVVRRDQLAECARLAADLPSVRFVLDHLGKPDIAGQVVKPWDEDLARLAACPNVAAKLSGLVTEADWASWRPADLRPFVQTALDLFGADRLMFGSDWPVCLLAASYRGVLDTMRDLLQDVAEADRAAIFGGTAAAFYRLDIGKPGVESPRRQAWH